MKEMSVALWFGCVSFVLIWGACAPENPSDDEGVGAYPSSSGSGAGTTTTSSGSGAGTTTTSSGTGGGNPDLCAQAAAHREECGAYPGYDGPCDDQAQCEAECDLAAPCCVFGSGCLYESDVWDACIDACPGHGCDAESVDCLACQGCAEADACYDLAANCAGNADCQDLALCVSYCDSDPACIDDCATYYPNGVALYTSYTDCVVCDQCYTLCDGAAQGCPAP